METLVAWLLLLGSLAETGEAPAHDPASAPVVDAAPEGAPLPPGVTLAGDLVVDLVAGRHGGRQVGEAALGWVVLSAAFDTAALELWDGGEVYVALQGTFGRQPSAFVGDVQVTSNIEAAGTVRTLEAWYEHRWAGSRHRVTAGVLDFNRHFDALDSAAVFLNSSFGVQPEIAEAGPPLFPDTTPGARLHSELAGGTYVQAGLYRGGPPSARGQRSGGIWKALELGWRAAPGAGPKLALGGWRRDGRLRDWEGAERDLGHGVYLIAERPWRLGRGPFALLESFLQLGRAGGGRQRIEEYAGAGVVLLTRANRERARTVGLAIAHARNGDGFLRANPEVRSAETVIELTGRIPVGENLHVQPDLQWVLHPGALPARNAVLVATVRLHATF